jgi:hypothetical protein
VLRPDETVRDETVRDETVRDDMTPIVGSTLTAILTGSLIALRLPMGRSHHPLVGVPAELHVVAGPEPLGVTVVGERALIGRSAACGVRLTDPAVEAHHASLSIDGGAVVVTQLAGRVPIVVDGTAIGGCSAPVGEWFEVGDTRLALGAPSVSGVGVIGVEVASGRAFCVPVAHGCPVGVVIDVACAQHATVAEAVLAAVDGNAVIAAAGSPALDECGAIVELGARWRARVTIDRSRPLDIARVHLCQPVTGRSSVCR